MIETTHLSIMRKLFFKLWGKILLLGYKKVTFLGRKYNHLLHFLKHNLCRIDCENILRYLILYVPFFIFLRVLGFVFVCTHTHFFLCAYGKRFLQIHIVIWFLFELTFGHNKMSLSFTFICTISSKFYFGKIMKHIFIEF